MTWTDDRVAQLMALWGTGPSASTIGATLGGLSRNAVISKAHRLGLATQKPQNRVPRASKPKSRKRKPPKRTPSNDNIVARILAVPPPSTYVELVIPEHERKTLLVTRDGKLHANDAFTAEDCHWPIGDPLTPEFHYCGKSVVPGLSYCEFHARAVFRPPQLRRPSVGTGVEPPSSPVEPTKTPSNKKLEVA